MDITEDQEKVLYTAIQRYGNDAQLDMIMEECSELIKAVCKYKRDRSASNGEEILKECADVMIMIKQALIMTNYLEINLYDQVDFKINRLKNRLNN